MAENSLFVSAFPLLQIPVSSGGSPNLLRGFRDSDPWSLCAASTQDVVYVLYHLPFTTAARVKPSVVIRLVLPHCSGFAQSVMYPLNLTEYSYFNSELSFTFVISQHESKSKSECGPPMRVNLYSVTSPTHHRFSELSQPLRSSRILPLDLLRQPPPVAFFFPATTVERLHPLLPLRGDIHPHCRLRVGRVTRHASHSKEPLPLFGRGVETHGGQDNTRRDRHATVFETVL